LIGFVKFGGCRKALVNVDEVKKYYRSAGRYILYNQVVHGLQKIPRENESIFDIAISS